MTGKNGRSVEAHWLQPCEKIRVELAAASPAVRAPPSAYLEQRRATAARAACFFV